VAFAQLAVMVLGGASLVGSGGARYLFAALLTGYELLFIARLGQTPAKDWLNVKVAVHPSDATPGLNRAARRWLLVLLALLVPDLWVTLALLVIVGAPTLLGARRGLHDLVAGTWVVDYDADEHDDVPDADFEPLDRLRKDRRFLRFRDEGRDEGPPT
jgi:uncharacterized RDD family membrane protein YckC